MKRRHRVKRVRRRSLQSHDARELVAGNQTEIGDTEQLGIGSDEGFSSDQQNSNNNSDDLPSPQLLCTLPQEKQVPFQCVEYKMDEYSNYNPKFGDLQKWKIYTKSEDKNEVKSEDLWFLKESNNHKQRRRVFVEGKVHRVYKINADDETFEAKMHLFLSWMITKEEYMMCIASDQKVNSGDVCPPSLMSHDKVWYPSVHIPNLIEGKVKFVETGGAKFRITSYKKFAGFGTESIESDANDFEIGNAKFIRCKMAISGVFHADFELRNFPFDVQEMQISIMERSGRGTFLPALRERKHFISVDPHFCYEVKEWDLAATMFEFVDTNPNYDSSSFGKALSQFIVDFKYQRNYWKYISRYWLVTMTITALSLMAFAFDYNANSDRCGFIIGLVLTVAFMDYQRPNTDQHTISDQYVTASHLFLSFMTVITGVAPLIMKEQIFDHYMFVLALSLFVAYHLWFVWIAYYKHRTERSKIHRTYNKEIEEMVEDEDVTLNKMRADYTKRFSDSPHSLTFVATKEMQ